jgi:hypothetical protein
MDSSRPMNARPTSNRKGKASAEGQERERISHIHTEFANFHEGYVRSYISLADTKAAVVFALASSLVAYLFTNDDFHNLLLAPTWGWQTALAYLTSFSLIFAAALSAWVIAPRTPHTGEGLVFFGAVRNYPTDGAYVRAVRDSSEAELTEARLRHCYDVSQVCWKKYRVLKGAIWSGVIGLILLLGTLAMNQHAGTKAPTQSSTVSKPDSAPLVGHSAKDAYEFTRR